MKKLWILLSLRVRHFLALERAARWVLLRPVAFLVFALSLNAISDVPGAALYKKLPLIIPAGGVEMIPGWSILPAQFVAGVFLVGNILQFFMGPALARKADRAILEINQNAIGVLVFLSLIIAATAMIPGASGVASLGLVVAYRKVLGSSLNNPFRKAAFGWLSKESMGLVVLITPLLGTASDQVAAILADSWSLPGIGLFNAVIFAVVGVAITRFGARWRNQVAPKIIHLRGLVGVLKRCAGSLHPRNIHRFHLRSVPSSSPTDTSTHHLASLPQGWFLFSFLILQVQVLGMRTVRELIAPALYPIWGIGQAQYSAPGNLAEAVSGILFMVATLVQRRRNPHAPLAIRPSILGAMMLVSACTYLLHGLVPVQWVLMGRVAEGSSGFLIAHLNDAMQVALLSNVQGARLDGAYMVWSILTQNICAFLLIPMLGPERAAMVVGVTTLGLTATLLVLWWKTKVIQRWERRWIR